MNKISCVKCGKMLAKHYGVGGLEIKCLRCGTLNKVFEKMIEQVIITDAQGKILFINQAVENASGYTLDEAIGKKPSELWGGQMSKEFYVDMWAKIKEGKQSAKFKMTNKNKNGELYNIELIVSPVTDTNGDILFFVGIEVVV